MTLERLDVMSLLAARRWVDGQPVGRVSPAGIGVRLGGLTAALSFGRLFWPEFVEVEGCVLISDNYNREVFEHWQARFSGDTREIERMVNLVDLEDLHAVATDDFDEPTLARVLDELSMVISRTWAAALEDSFPGRKFNIGRFAGDDGDYPAVWFHTEVPPHRN